MLWTMRYPDGKVELFHVVGGRVYTLDNTHVLVLCADGGKWSTDISTNDLYSDSVKREAPFNSTLIQHVLTGDTQSFIQYATYMYPFTHLGGVIRDWKITARIEKVPKNTPFEIEFVDDNHEQINIIENKMVYV